MKLRRFLFLTTFSAAFWSSCVAQPAIPTKTRSDAVVSVHELPLPPKARREFEKGTRLLLNGDAKGSVAYFLKAVDKAPFCFRPYQNLAVAYLNLDQLDVAADNFQKAIELTNGEFAPAIFGLAVVLYRQSDFHGAERLARQGLQLQPGSALGHYCMGLVHFSLGRTADAELSAREALDLDASEVDAYMLLGAIHAKQHNPSAALKDAKAYLKLSPQGPLRLSALELVRQSEETLATAFASQN